jgi:hypothetical protein
VIKVNSHVGIIEGSEGDRFGLLRRYDRDSSCCGMLNALMSGRPVPSINELHDEFNAENPNRLATLLDENKVDPKFRPLYAAIVSARVQARKVVLDIQDYKPLTDTVYLVIPCVTLNRSERDTEIVCGIYSLDSRESDQAAHFVGLGDDPADYHIELAHQRYTVTDSQIGARRKARDHRRMVAERWRKQATDPHPKLNDERMKRLRKDVLENKHRHHHHGKLMLRALLTLLAEAAPIPAAMLLFGHGLVGIHHAFRVHKLSRKLAGKEEARNLLADVHQKLDHLEPDQAEAMVDLLMAEFHR